MCKAGLSFETSVSGVSIADQIARECIECGQCQKECSFLNKQIQHLGIVLDCCFKPSHDLGRQQRFAMHFNQIKMRLWENNIHTIILACPSCHQIFKQYAPEFEVIFVYEIMAEKGVDHAAELKGKVTIHDPCQARIESQVHKSVRTLVEKTGLSIAEMDHTKKNTICCGQGGAAGSMAPDLAVNWSKKRCQEAGDRKLITYCVGCIRQLSDQADVVHVLDLVFNAKKNQPFKAPACRFGRDYLNRILFKRQLKTYF
jgi:Fe-S oxidoreductase